MWTKAFDYGCKIPKKKLSMLSKLNLCTFIISRSTSYSPVIVHWLLAVLDKVNATFSENIVKTFKSILTFFCEWIQRDNVYNQRKQDPNTCQYLMHAKFKTKPVPKKDNLGFKSTKFAKATNIHKTKRLTANKV